MTTFYNLTNKAVTYLASAVATGDLVLYATGGGSLFPTGNFPVSCDSEIMICTSRTTNNFTVTRGAEGTTIATHATGAMLSLNVTKGIVQELQNFATAHEAATTGVHGATGANIVITAPAYNSSATYFLGRDGDWHIPAGTGASVEGSWYIFIAANGAQTAEKTMAGATRTCDATADQAQLNTAIDTLISG